jgi:hypothetical protein
MKHALALLFALALPGTAALAETMPGTPPAGPRMPAPEKFQMMKDKAAAHHQQRLQLDQQTLACIQAATGFEQLRTCHQKERQAYEQMAQQHRKEHMEMRDKMQGGAMPGGMPGR